MGTGSKKQALKVDFPRYDTSTVSLPVAVVIQKSRGQMSGSKSGRAEVKPEVYVQLLKLGLLK